MGLFGSKEVQFDSTATLRAKFGEGVTQDQAWERLTTMFDVKGSLYSLVPGAWPLEKVIRGTIPSPGTIYEYILTARGKSPRGRRQAAV